MGRSLHTFQKITNTNAKTLNICELGNLRSLEAN